MFTHNTLVNVILYYTVLVVQHLTQKDNPGPPVANTDDCSTPEDINEDTGP